MSIYLDYNASAPINKEVLNCMFEVYTTYQGNADSRTHEFGKKARDIVEHSRIQVASLLGIKADEVFFTSGATESNNIAIQGLIDYAEKTGKKHIITSSIEHKAVLETVKNMQKKGFDVDIIDPDITGRVLPEQIIEKVKEDTLLVSLMHVNNETGIIQPVKEIGEYLAEREVLFHVDATQSCGKLIPELCNLEYNMMSISSHKMQGPQGVGVLVLRKKGYRLPPVKNIMYGGGQEHGIRPGTIPVALVAGCGKACEICESKYVENTNKLIEIKMELCRILTDSGVTYHFNGDQHYCVDNTMNICIPGVNSEALMISTKQFCGISSGSACTAKDYSPSYVLSAMGISRDLVECSIRISWGPDTEIEDLKQNFSALLQQAKQMQ